MWTARFCVPRFIVVGLAALALFGCSSKEVVVQGNFPEPLLTELPVSMGVFYPSSFVNHEIFDAAQLKGEPDWRVSTGAAQVKFWEQFFAAFFESSPSIFDWETLQEQRHQVDAILVPRVTDLQYTVPERTNRNVYEIQFFYSFSLVSPDAFHINEAGSIAFDTSQVIADWSLVSYGKTPSAFIQSQEEAINLAAVVSLRDAGANFAQNFVVTPSIADWLEDTMNPTPTSSEKQDNEQ